MEEEDYLNVADFTDHVELDEYDLDFGPGVDLSVPLEDM